MGNEKNRSRLLVIDDDSTIRAMLETALGTQYDVLSLPNGDEVLKTLVSYSPNLLLLDINIPGSDGFEICERVRAQAKLKRFPILFMTIRKDNRAFLKSLESGGDAQIHKPFEIPALRERIELLLKNYRES